MRKDSFGILDERGVARRETIEGEGVGKMPLKDLMSLQDERNLWT